MSREKTTAFLHAVEETLLREGGFVENPRDPGGTTNWGISFRRHERDLPMWFWKKPGNEAESDQQRAAAIELYFGKYWLPIYDDLASPEVAAKVFDLAVNTDNQPLYAGDTLRQKRAAHHILQRALLACHRRVQLDGVLGLNTLRAANSCDPGRLLVALRSEAAGHYRALIARRPELTTFEHNWIKRAYDLYERCMVTGMERI